MKATTTLGISLLLTMRGCAASARGPALVANPELSAFTRAASWSGAAPATILIAAQQHLAAHREAEGYRTFSRLASAAPDVPLYRAVAGLMQARIADQVALLSRVKWVEQAMSKLDDAVARDPVFSRYLRGLVFAELPARFHAAQRALDDLQTSLQNRQQLPFDAERGLYLAIAHAQQTLGKPAEAARARASAGVGTRGSLEPQLLVSVAVDPEDGYRFGPERVQEVAQGIFLAEGYDFANMFFLDAGASLIAVDAGTTPETSARARDALLRVTGAKPVRTVLLTHAHWDHIGGLSSLLHDQPTVVGQAHFDEELALVNAVPRSFVSFFGSHALASYSAELQHRVSAREQLEVGDRVLELIPVGGGETSDGLLIHDRATGTMLVGDVFMPYLGSPFSPEGSPEGLLESIRIIRELAPQRLQHGHSPLTRFFTVDALPGLELALRELLAHSLEAIHQRRSLADQLGDDLLPGALEQHPHAVVPYLVMRENFVKRVFHQHTGYWKADGEGLEVLSEQSVAQAIDTLGGNRESAFSRTAEQLLGTGDHALALKISNWGLARYPRSARLQRERAQALEGLRAKYQQINPFKFIVFSDMAQLTIAPVEPEAVKTRELAQPH